MATSTYKFFIRNIISNGVDYDLIHMIVDGGEAQKTAFIARKSDAKKAKELASVAHFQEWADAPYLAAIKAFMVMGFNSAMTYAVSDDGTVAVA